MSSLFTPTPKDNIELLRDAVAWANAQREDYWHPPVGESMPVATVIGVYLAVVRYLDSTIEEVIADDLPFKWSEYNDKERAAINYVRRALRLPSKR